MVRGNFKYLTVQKARVLSSKYFCNKLPSFLKYMSNNCQPLQEVYSQHQFATKIPTRYTKEIIKLFGNQGLIHLKQIYTEHQYELIKNWSRLIEKKKHQSYTVAWQEGKEEQMIKERSLILLQASILFAIPNLK